MKKEILDFLESNTDDHSKYPVAEMRDEIETRRDIFLHEIATEFERAVEKAKRLNMKTFPSYQAATALSTFMANVIAYQEEADDAKKETFLINCMDCARQLWNISKFVNTR